MQKFQFSKTVFAPDLEKAEEIMRDLMEAAATSSDGQHALHAFDVEQISRRPPHEKPGALYYSIRDGKRRIGAVTLLYRGVYNRGIVILAEGDSFDGRYARKESYRRALMASRTKRCSLVSHCATPAIVRFHLLFMQLSGCAAGQYKSIYDATPTAYELELIRKGGVQLPVAASPQSLA